MIYSNTRVEEMSKKSYKRSRSKILADINKLIDTRGYIMILAEILSRDFFVDTRDVAGVNWRERLHNNEAGFLLGLMLKSKEWDFSEPSKKTIERGVFHTRRLLEELHQSLSHMDRMNDIMLQSIKKYGSPDKVPEEEKEQHFQEIFGSKEAIIESTFYGDAGYYDIQCHELAPRLYAYDTDWLASNVGLSFETMRAIYEAVNGLTNAMHYVRRDKELREAVVGNNRQSPMRAIDEFAFPLDLIVRTVRTQDKSISQDDVKKFLKLFSCKPGEQLKDFAEPGDENIYSYKPIIEIQDNIYFLPNKMLLASAIYKSPLYRMRQNAKYVNKANKHIGDVTEDIAAEYFVDIFGVDNVYKDIDIYVGRNRVTDIDVMGVLGNTIVIAQNKSKKMTQAALSGDVDKIKDDFEKAVIEPYKQGIKVRDILLGDATYSLKDRSGKKIILPQGIENAYILCISNEPYPAVLDQMRVFLKDVDQLPPMQISLFDLDLMAMYLKDPYDFAFYIKQRLENHEMIITSNEIIPFAYHLMQGLFMPEDANMFIPDPSYGQYVDADYYHKKMGTPKPKDEDRLILEWHNEWYENLVELIKKTSDPSKVDMIFFLKGISPGVIDDLTKHIKSLNKKASDGKFHNLSMPITTSKKKPWGGITYAVGGSFRDAMHKLPVLCEMDKYRSKSNAWLGIAARQDGVVGFTVFTNQPYVQSRDMDEKLEYYLAHFSGREVNPEEEEQDPHART